MITIPIKLDEGAEMPIKAHKADAGYDFKAKTKNITPKFVEYGTGVYMHIPAGYVGLIFPRSSVTKKDLMLKNSVGIIDSGYLGEIRFRFYHPTLDLPITPQGGFLDDYEVGDFIGQMLVIELPDIKFKQVDDLEETERGTGGYGSTDEKRKQ